MKDTETEAAFDKNQQDLQLDDLTVWWIGQLVVLSLQGRSITTLTADERVVYKIKRWCVKNHYRCSQVAGGKLQL